MDDSGLDDGLSALSAPPSPDSFASPAPAPAQQPSPPGAAASPGGLLDMSQPSFGASMNSPSAAAVPTNSPPQAAAYNTIPPPPGAAVCPPPQPRTPPSCGGPPLPRQSAGTPRVQTCGAPQQQQQQQQQQLPQPQQLQQQGDLMRGGAPPSPTIPYTSYVPKYPAQSSPGLQQGAGTMRDLIVTGEDRARQGLTDEERSRLQPGLSPVSPGPPYNTFNFLERSCMTPYVQKPSPGPHGTPPFERFVGQPLDRSTNIPSYSPSPPFKIPYYNQSPNMPGPYVPSPVTPGQGQNTGGLNQAVYDPSYRTPDLSTQPQCCSTVCPTCSQPVGVGQSYYAPDMSAMGYSYASQPGQVSAGQVSAQASAIVSRPGNTSGPGQGQDGLLSMTPPSFQNSYNQSMNDSGGQRSGSAGNPGASPQAPPYGAQQESQSRMSRPTPGTCGPAPAQASPRNNSANSTGLDITIPNPSQILQDVGNGWDTSVDASPGSVRASPAQDASPMPLYFADTPVPGLGSPSPAPTVASPGLEGDPYVPASAPRLSTHASAAPLPAPVSTARLSVPMSAGRVSAPVSVGFLSAPAPVGISAAPGVHIDAASGLSDSDDRGLQILQTTQGRRSSLSKEEIAEIEAYLNSHILTEEQVENVRQMLIARGCNLFTRGRSSLGEGIAVVPTNARQSSSRPAPDSPPATLSRTGSIPEGTDANIVPAELMASSVASIAGSDTVANVDAVASIVASTPTTGNDSPEPRTSFRTSSRTSENSGRGSGPSAPPPSMGSQPGSARASKASVRNSLNTFPTAQPETAPEVENGLPTKTGNDTSSFYFSPEQTSKKAIPETCSPALMRSSNPTGATSTPSAQGRTEPQGADGYPAQSTPIQNAPSGSASFLNEGGQPLSPMTKPIEPYSGNNEIDPAQNSRYLASPENTRAASDGTQDSTSRHVSPPTLHQGMPEPNPEILLSVEPVIQDYLYKSLTTVIQDLMRDGKWPWRFCNCPCPEYPDGNGEPKSKMS